MLAEFALLPSIFDQKAHPDVAAWKEQLSELARGMFPRNVGCPVVIADLQDGEWWNHSRRIVERLPVGDSRRSDLLAFLTRIKSVMVRRPGHIKKLVTHLDWAREALASHESVRFERIVAGPGDGEQLRKESKDVWDLSAVGGDEFWDRISPDWSPPQDISKQVEMLSKICLHGEFLSLISPHIGGRSDDETDFAAALIRRAFDRQPGYPTPQIEVHVEGPSVDAAHPAFTDALRTKVDNIVASLREALQPGQRISLVVWPKLLDRYLLAGLVQAGASGANCKCPRWGVNLGHIARKSDSRRPTSDTEWKLLKRDRLVELFQRYAADGVTGYLPPSPILITKER